MGMATNPFTPGSVTQILSATGTSSSVTIANPKNQQVRIAAVAGGQITFIRFAASASAALVTDMPILPGAVEVFSIGESITIISAITSTSTQTLYVTYGDGA